MKGHASLRDLHRAADTIEPRLARAFVRAVERMREHVSINALALAITAKDVRLAERLLSRAMVEEAMAPCGTIARDAVMRGGRLGAELVTKALRRASGAA